MDFIRKYVFPGGSLPSMSTMLNSIAKSSDLTLFHAESYASSYGKTLDIWYQRFINNKDKIIELGYSKAFMRLWEYYLKYCQSGFEERVIDVQQLVLKKPSKPISVMKKGMGFLIFNFLGLQATWAACAYGATHNQPMLGFYVGLAYISTHFIIK